MSAFFSSSEQGDQLLQRVFVDARVADTELRALTLSITSSFSPGLTVPIPARHEDPVDAHVPFRRCVVGNREEDTSRGIVVRADVPLARRILDVHAHRDDAGVLGAAVPAPCSFSVGARPLRVDAQAEEVRRGVGNREEAAQSYSDVPLAPRVLDVTPAASSLDLSMRAPPTRAASRSAFPRRFQRCLSFII